MFALHSNLLALLIPTRRSFILLHCRGPFSSSKHSLSAREPSAAAFWLRPPNIIFRPDNLTQQAL